MIYEKEMVPFGLSTVHANDAVSGIIDVSVDAALGPNVHQNLLRNLNNKQMVINIIFLLYSNSFFFHRPKLRLALFPK
jgi:hypothetical protein